uniref:Stabilin 1 n=1 Tax=Podarcis muralis TaxID=64176 RepID=A0A670IMJ0_PODMU
GPDCQSVCECQHGICNHGPSGDGSCTCYAGYTGPKCDQELLNCGGVICEANSICVVKGGQSRCECLPGYKKNGIYCQDQDPCSSYPCSSFATCKTLGPNKYECTCKAGYLGNGKICQPINPCLTDNGGCPRNSSLCSYIRPGEARCLCKPGFIRHGDKDCFSTLSCQPHNCDRSAKCEIDPDTDILWWCLIFLQNCGLPSFLDGPGPFTVFVPSNEAVDKLRDGRLIYLFTEVSVGSENVETLITLPQILTMANQVLTIHFSEEVMVFLPFPDRHADGPVHLDFPPVNFLWLARHDGYTSNMCEKCSLYSQSVSFPKAEGIFPGECVYIHDPLGLNIMKKGCKRNCNQTVVVPGCCKGFFGSSCTPCPSGFTNPCYGKGTCSDGIRGNGQCHCHENFRGIACHICSNPNKHGENCDEDCGCVHGICDNRPGSKGVCQPGSCKAGYSGEFCDRSSQKCASSDDAPLNCHLNAVCIRNDTVRCVCLDGYEGDGFSCEPIDVCSKSERGGCSKNAMCTSTGPGRATCQCNKGWTGDGKDCIAIDNCAMETRGGCHVNADCIYIGPGQSSCICKRNYNGDGYSCDPVAPCSVDNGGCHELMAIWIINNLFPIFSFKLAKEANNTCFCFVFCFGQKKSLFSIPEGTNLTVLVPVKEAIQNLSKDEKDFWLQPDMLLLLVRGHFLLGSFTTEQLKKYVGQELPTLSPRIRWKINNSSGDMDTVQYHVVLGVKLLATDLKSGVHKTSMLGFSYWLMFYKNTTQAYVNKVLLNGQFVETTNGMLIGVSEVLRVQKNRCSINSTTVQKVSVCCSGYYGHMCEMCPGKPDRWCSGNGVCQDGIDGNGECQCHEGYHGTACEMCQPGRYGANCKSECNCAHGICNDGLLGDGSCTCAAGFKGVSCDIEIDPCAVGNGGCSPHASCTKVGPGQRTCSCKEGYAGDGTLCRGEHPCCLKHMNCQYICRCMSEHTGCSPHALCLSTSGDRICICLSGTGDGFTCTGTVCLKPLSRQTYNNLLHLATVAHPSLVIITQEQKGFVHEKVCLTGNVYYVPFSQNSVYLNDEAKIIESDIMGSNGVLHFIDKILIPYDLQNINISSNLAQVADAYGYKIYSKLLVAGLLNLVNSTLHQPFTMLWPTDAAFNSLPEDMQKWLYHREHRSKLAAYLKGHMIRDTLGEILVNNGNARIVQQLMKFNGGIAYGIDQVLEPPDLGSRCDEFRDVERPSVSVLICTYLLISITFLLYKSPKKLRVSPGKVPTLKKKLQWNLSCRIWRPLSRSLMKGCRRTCFVVEWVPQCCPNHYGKDCQVCPGGLKEPCSNHGTCNDGQQGSGWCSCNKAFIGTACENCAPGHYGPECKECNCTSNGICDEGLHGDGFCFCSAGWTGERCETELAAVPVCSPACHRNAVCRSNNTCECSLHYEGDGWTCKVIDRCAKDNGDCSDYANCTQIGTDVSCSCFPDYEGDGYICSPIDRCADGMNGDCSEHATCINTGPNSRRCECHAGYVGNGIQCLEEAIPPIDRCLENNGQCHSEALCSDLHFEEKTVGVFHLQSPQGKYRFTYQEAEAACAAEGATVATLKQLSAAQQMGFHRCVVGWLYNGSAGYPTVYPSLKCGSHHVGIVDYGFRSNASEKWDAYCYRVQDVQCVCRDGFVGDGYTCTGSLVAVLAQKANFSVYYSMVLDYANATQEGWEFFNFLSTDMTYKTLFVPLNSGFRKNAVRNAKQDFVILLFCTCTAALTWFSFANIPSFISLEQKTTYSTCEGMQNLLYLHGQAPGVI